ncbi:MAG: PEP-utilizing enzyme, partial [Verrucomicrobiia bacterium]
WTPLFSRASGLVIECGGALSHGAVVAREMGLPAVVLPNATALFRQDQELILNASAGYVGPAELANQAMDRIRPEELPPPPDRFERRNLRLITWGFAGWAIFLILAYAVAPRWLLDPIYAVLDQLLLPLWRQWGLLAVPAVVAVGFAIAATVGQRWLTNNARLLLAKSRAEKLRKRVREEGLQGRIADEMTRSAQPVTGRLLSASLAPLAVLIGPMVLSFTWMTARLDPASWPPSPGATIHLTATMNGEFTREVHLQADPALVLSASTPARQSPPPIRKTLSDFRAELQATAVVADNGSKPWPVLAAATQARDALLADLGAYLSRPMPPTSLAWTLSSPETPGVFPLELRADGAAPVTLKVTLGAGLPPQPRTPDGATMVQLWENPDLNHPVQKTRIAFAERQVRGSNKVWTPLAGLGWPVDLGWLGAYLVFYLPPFFLLRWILRLP